MDVANILYRQGVIVDVSATAANACGRLVALIQAPQPFNEVDCVEIARFFWGPGQFIVSSSPRLAFSNGTRCR